MSNCEGGNSITMFSKVAGKVYEKWNYFEASCDPVLTFSEQNFVAGQYLADYTKSRVSSEKKKRHGREEEERERDGGISLMPRAVRWPWLNASPNSLGPLIRPIHSGQCARCVCVHVQEPEQAIRCVYTCACRRLCVCVCLWSCVSQHQFPCVNMLTWHNTSRHFEVGNRHCNLPPSLSHRARGET